LLPLRVFPDRRFPADWSFAGALPGPRREVPGGRELAHVNADLGDQDLGAALLDARDRAQQLKRV
jgi:hypothetical protein